MQVVNSFLSAIVTRDEEGQGLAEYALILALIFLGGQISSILSSVGNSI